MKDEVQVEWIVEILDIDSQDRLVDFRFKGTQFSQYAPYLSVMAQILPGKTIEEILSLGTEIFHRFNEGEPLVFAPLLVLQKSLEDYLGLPPPFCEQKGQKDSDLVCRCFGVYGDEIQSLLKQNPEFQLKDITKILKAGGGCTSCRPQIQQIQQILQIPKVPFPNSEKTESFKGPIPPPRSTKNYVAGLTPVQFAIKIQPMIDAWMITELRGEDPAQGKLQLKLMKIQEGVLIFQGRMDPGKKIWERFTQFLRGFFGEDLLFSLTLLD